MHKKYPQYKNNLCGQYINSIRGYLVFNPISRFLVNLLGLIIENGIKLKLEGIITSKPYILMTRELIQKIGYNVTVDQNYIQVSDINKCLEKTIIVESDSEV